MNHPKIKDVNIDLNDFSDEELLKVRMCDLNLQIDGTMVDECIGQLKNELLDRALPVPVFYISDEWFSPDQYFLVAIPFYLLHPKLAQLEQRMMMEIEGGSYDECLKLLRHECAHAYVHLYQLNKRKKWIEIFGNPQREYQDFYRYRPYSRSYVIHLKNCYAQAHPEEDFAETFAVWLDPQSNWNKSYLGWPAHKKLLYVDQLMQQLSKRNKAVDILKESDYPYDLKQTQRKLSTHYKNKKKLYAEESETYFDQDLCKMFILNNPDLKKAEHLLKKHFKIIIQHVSQWSQERKYVVQRLLIKMIQRSKQLKLSYHEKDETSYLLNFVSYLSSLVANYTYTTRFKKNK